jgi:hypothetical protein
MIIGSFQRTWLRTAALGFAVCVLSIGVVGQAAAQDAAKPPDKPADATPPPPDPDKVTLNFFKGTEVGGLLDTYYAWYSTKANGAYRSFDDKHNTFDIGMAEVWLGKTPDKDSPIGYKIRLNFGHATSVFTPATDSDYKNIEEAYGSYLAPVGKGLQIDFGKFVTNAGAEVVEAKDNWNYSRSLLFTLAIPVYHAGIRLTYSPNDKVTLMGGVVNGWNNVVDNNTGKTVMFSVTYKPNAATAVIENYIGGPEQPSDSTDWRTLSDTVITYTVNPKVSLIANYDYTRDTVLAKTNTTQGIAGYVKFQANKWVAVVPRAEYFKDGQGAPWATGLAGGQNLTEFTLTLEAKAADNFLWRTEYRGDFSNKSPFRDSTGVAKKNQQSLTFGFLYSFSSKS